MKILNETEITLEKLMEKVQSQPTIITRDGTPVMVVLPVGNRERDTWNEQLMILIKHLVERLGQESNPRPVQPREEPSGVEPGMVEVSMALAGVATAIAAFLPGITGTPATLTLIVAIFSSVVACFSAYSALWLLACYCLRVGLEESSPGGIREIHTLLKSPSKTGPYWLIALGLLFLLALSVLIGAFAVRR
jgi:PHD/YefM family antitoxin component YafN of YafNO toxin-antitoxin module